MKSRTRSMRWRTRVFPVLTLLIAVVWWWGTRQASAQIKSVNAASLFGMLLAGPMAQPDSAYPSPMLGPLIPGLLPSVPDSTAHENSLEASRTKAQITYTEGIVAIWEWSMYGIAGLLIIVACLSLMTPWARWLHLLAAGVILLSTLGSWLGLRQLIDPNKGGMPPLSVWTYVFVGIVHSVYGAVLLAVYARKDRSTGKSKPQPPQVLRT